MDTLKFLCMCAAAYGAWLADHHHLILGTVLAVAATSVVFMTWLKE